jgi:hypothetical protein
MYGKKMYKKGGKDKKVTVQVAEEGYTPQSRRQKSSDYTPQSQRGKGSAGIGNTPDKGWEDAVQRARKAKKPK